jgi:hypothetical protein
MMHQQRRQKLLEEQTYVCQAIAFATWVAFVVPAAAEMIHLRARQGSVSDVQAEIDMGVPIDLRSTKHTSAKEVTALFVASKFGTSEVVKMLLENGAGPTLFLDTKCSPHDRDSPASRCEIWLLRRRRSSYRRWSRPRELGAFCWDATSSGTCQRQSSSGRALDRSWSPRTGREALHWLIEHWG